MVLWNSVVREQIHQLPPFFTLALYPSCVCVCAALMLQFIFIFIFICELQRKMTVCPLTITKFNLNHKLRKRTRSNSRIYTYSLGTLHTSFIKVHKEHVYMITSVNTKKTKQKISILATHAHL